MENEYETGIRFEHDAGDDTATVELVYPRNDNHPNFIEVGLEDVRAADSLRISYDFERDGWKIEQASIFSWPALELFGTGYKTRPSSYSPTAPRRARIRI